MLRLSVRRLALAYLACWLLLVAAAAAVALLQVPRRIRVPFTAIAEASAPSRFHFELGIPARFASDVTPGTPVRLRDRSGCLDVRARATRVDGHAESRSPLPIGLVVARGEAFGARCSERKLSGEAELALGSEPAAALLFPAARGERSASAGSP